MRNVIMRYEKDNTTIEILQAKNAQNVFKINLIQGLLVVKTKIVTVDEIALKTKGINEALPYIAQLVLTEYIEEQAK